MGEAIVETRGVESAYQTVVKFDASGPRIHIFWRGDGDPDCHDHPADFVTFPLTSYVEEYWTNGVRRTRVVKAFRLHRRKAEFAHRVIGSFEGKYHPLSVMEWAAGFDPEPIAGSRPIVTIVWWGKKRREWGFRTPKGWVPWRTYIDAVEAQASAGLGDREGHGTERPLTVDGSSRDEPLPPPTKSDEPHSGGGEG